jgi:hypothetical protein
MTGINTIPVDRVADAKPAKTAATMYCSRSSNRKQHKISKRVNDSV